MKINKIVRGAKTLLSILMLMVLLLPTTKVFAVEPIEGFGFAVSPMKEKVVLNPGDKYTSSIEVYTTAQYTMDIKYKITVAGYYVNENYEKIFEECETRCDMADWITIESPTEGRLSPNQETKVRYTINVPENAAGGGQYASIIVEAEPWVDESESSDDFDDSSEGVKSALTERKRIAYTIYAEIAGDIVRQGEIISLDVPSFLLSGSIKGTSSVKNTGNVHGEAKYKLQVFPLFSSEEIYTNEENPDDRTILPDRTLYNETVWEGTPGIGIFNVVYTVEFEGITAQVKKMVIKCPVWLLFIIIFAIVAIIIYFFVRAKARKASRN